MPSIAVNGIQRVLKPIHCTTCTVVFFVFGEIKNVDWDAINAMAAKYEAERGT